MACRCVKPAVSQYLLYEPLNEISHLKNMGMPYRRKTVTIWNHWQSLHMLVLQLLSQKKR